MQHQDQYKRKTTDTELKKFLASTVYKDFSNIANMRLDVIRDEMCSATTMEQVTKLQGEMRGVEFWITFPEELAKAIMEDRENAAKTNPK